jgi:type IV secretion system protein VirB5
MTEIFEKLKSIFFSNTGSSSSNANIYIKQRQIFHDKYLDLSQSRNNWRNIAFLMCIFCFFCIAGVIYMGSRSHITPYIVEVNKLGMAKSFGKVEDITIKDNRIIIATLHEIFFKLRTVYSDKDVLGDNMRKAYMFMDTDARSFLNSHFRSPQNNPVVLAKNYNRSIEIRSIVPLNSKDIDSWRVQWIETTVPTGNGDYSKVAWEAFVNIKVIPPSEEDEDFSTNPLGIYVTDMTWGKVSSKD